MRKPVRRQIARLRQALEDRDGRHDRSRRALWLVSHARREAWQIPARKIGCLPDVYPQWLNWRSSLRDKKSLLERLVKLLPRNSFILILFIGKAKEKRASLPRAAWNQERRQPDPALEGFQG